MQKVCFSSNLATHTSAPDSGSPYHDRSGVRLGGVLHTGRSVLGSGVRLGPFSHTGRTVPTSKIRSSLLIPGLAPGSPIHDPTSCPAPTGHLFPCCQWATGNPCMSHSIELVQGLFRSSRISYIAAAVPPVPLPSQCSGQQTLSVAAEPRSRGGGARSLPLQVRTQKSAARKISSRCYCYSSSSDRLLVPSSSLTGRFSHCLSTMIRRTG